MRTKTLTKRMMQAGTMMLSARIAPPQMPKHPIDDDSAVGTADGAECMGRRRR